MLVAAGAVLWLILSLAVLVHGDLHHAWGGAHVHGTLSVTDSEGGRTPIAIAEQLGSLAVELAVGWCLFRLLGLYAAGTIFSSRNAAWIRWIGVLLLISGSGALSLVISLLMSWSSPTPTLQFVQDVDTLVSGAFLVLLSWVMEEGRRLQVDQEPTI